MIGIGVGIDYALFIVTRYREGLKAGLDPEQSTVVALDTAGRAVVFAGFTVVISLLGMFIMGLSFINGLATGAAVTVLVTMIASVTLLPALLGFAQRKVRLDDAHGSSDGRALRRFPLTFAHPIHPELAGQQQHARHQRKQRAASGLQRIEQHQP